MIECYIKKQTVVEAVQWTGENLDEIRTFCGLKAETYNSGLVNVGPMIVLQTPDGPSALKVGDYVVRDRDAYFLYRQEVFEENFTKHESTSDDGVTIAIDSIGASAGTSETPEG